MIRKKTIRFEASAYLQRLVGRELVPNEEMAVIELVKNAYDSGATRVNIFIQPTTAREPGFVRVADDGSGMSEDDVEGIFMFAGFSERTKQLRRQRIPTGEKGIGRFAADKLGEILNVYTRQRGEKAGLHLTIDWRDFNDRAKKFNEVEAAYLVGPVHQVMYSSGTTLEISRLRSTWDPTRIEGLRLGLSDLFNPFARPKDFTLTLEVAGSRTGIETIDPVSPEADLEMRVSVESVSKVHRTIKTGDDHTTPLDERKGTAASLDDLQDLRVRFLYFRKRPSKKASKGLEPGVRVFRDGFRIEPFGSRTADWLGIAEKRAKRAGHAHIVPSRIFGFVEISRRSNPELSDTTSRQALLGSDAVKSLVTLLREQLDAFEDFLRKEAEPRWEQSRRTKAIVLEQARLHTLGVMSFGLAHELRQPLQAITSEAFNIRARLQKLGIVDKGVLLAQQAIDRGVERIDKNITLISEITKGSVETKAKIDLVDLVAQRVSLLRHRCAAQGVELLLEAPKVQTATVNEFVVDTVLGNYVQNAIDSIAASRKGTRIRVLVQKKKNGDHYLEVADDGPGVPNEIAPNLFKKFATGKTGGMGVGLFYCKSIVEMHGGRVGFSSKAKGARFWMTLPEG